MVTFDLTVESQHASTLPVDNLKNRTPNGWATRSCARVILTLAAPTCLRSVIVRNDGTAMVRVLAVVAGDNTPHVIVPRTQLITQRHASMRPPPAIMQKPRAFRSFPAQFTTAPCTHVLVECHAFHDRPADLVGLKWIDVLGVTPEAATLDAATRAATVAENATATRKRADANAPRLFTDAEYEHVVRVRKRKLATAVAEIKKTQSATRHGLNFARVYASVQAKRANSMKRV
jgi:hypothetical protein